MMLLQSVALCKLIGTGLFIVLVLAACAPSESGDTLASADNTTVSADTGTDSRLLTPTSIATFPIVEDITILTEDDRPQRLLSATRSWNTNWNKHPLTTMNCYLAAHRATAFLPSMRRHLSRMLKPVWAGR